MSTPEINHAIDRLEHRMNAHAIPKHPDPKVRAAAAVVFADKLAIYLMTQTLIPKIRVLRNVWFVVGFAAGLLCGWWWLA